MGSHLCPSLQYQHDRSLPHKSSTPHTELWLKLQLQEMTSSDIPYNSPPQTKNVNKPKKPGNSLAIR